jgi:RsiW-degrading membrane proteinase PrsW (M82 family)
MTHISDHLRRPWVLTLIGGLVLWVGLRWALVTTDNINLVPSLIVLGASLGPVVFVLYVYERAPEVPSPVLLICFLAGGVLGVTAASVIEYRTLLELRALPTIAIGLIEESCKLVVPLAVFFAGRYRREADGLLFGVASGMGFAAFETMGYGLTALLLSHGRIDDVDQLLFARGVLATAGHAAWTGLICATLWHARAYPSTTSRAAVPIAFLTAVTLHALWDSMNSPPALVPVALVSYGLLAWRIEAAGRATGPGTRAVAPAPAAPSPTHAAGPPTPSPRPPRAA